MPNLTPAVQLIDGQPLVSSLDIAAHFEKPHDAVLKAIRKIVSECPTEFHLVNFYEVLRTIERPDGSKIQTPLFNLTRDAFALVVMGFTGKKALAWKLVYIEAFNGMEKALLAAAQKAVSEATPAIESKEDRKRRKDRERQRRYRELAKIALSSGQKQKALPPAKQLAMPTDDNRIQKLNAAFEELREKGKDFASVVFKCRAIMRNDPCSQDRITELVLTMNNSINHLSVSIDMSVESLIGMWRIYAALAAK